jgi:AraC family transcriptional regulator
LSKNKSARWINYEDRLQRVTSYIHEHLDEELDLNRLAEVACLSPFHWHRLYHAVHGETAVATVKRLRLQRAAGELVKGTLSIAKIAQRAGYSSVAPFHRAFHEAYGLPPAAWRTAEIRSAYKQSDQPGGSLMFTVTLRQMEPRMAITLPHRGSYQQIGRVFEKLGTWFAVRGLWQPDTRMVGIYFDDPSAVPEAELRSLAGILVTIAPEVEAPYAITPIVGGACAVLQHKGPYADLPTAYQWLYGSWLPQSGHELADAPAYEEYLNDPRDTAPTELLTDICVPLKS